jgi:hypothetical protein
MTVMEESGMFTLISQLPDDALGEMAECSEED